MWSWPTTRASQMEYFHSLRPSPKEMRTCRSNLGKIVYVLHQKVKSKKIHVNRVKTCGSVGKGTASAKSSDLDLVVFLDDLEPEQLAFESEGVLDKIQQALDEQYPGTRDTEWYRKFGLRYFIAGMEIDILVAVTNVHPRDFLSVADPLQRQYMSASVSHMATKLMKKQGLFFQDMVRVVKDWRDSYDSWPPDCKPKSYLLEVLMLKACSECHQVWSENKNGVYYYGTRAAKEKTNVLLHFFQLIMKAQPYQKGMPSYQKDRLPELFVTFDKYYKASEIPLDEPEPLFERTRIIGKGTKAKTKTRIATAIVLDPCNPTNNLWLTLADSKPLISRATETWVNLC